VPVRLRARHSPGATTLTAKAAQRGIPHRRPDARGGRADQEKTVPKSRTRSKAVYTPPQKSAKSKVSPRWLAPTMLGCLLLGLAWIATFYVSNGALPISAMGSWNLVVGFGFLVGGVVLSTKWH
jgi:hypothetical protein